MLRMEPVSVTGMGCVCAAGTNLKDILRALEAGQRAPLPPSRFKSGHTRTYPVFEVPEHVRCEQKNGPDLSMTAHFALHAVKEALLQAGLAISDLDTSRVGVCIGTSVGASLNLLDFYRGTRAGQTPDLEPVHRYLNSNPAVTLAHALGTTGPVQTVVNACSSGADAIGLAASWIAQGICDIVIAGGADEMSEVTYNGFIRLMISDQSPCRPFDKSRGGLNLGEGAGIVILEASASREKRNAGELATILGYGTAADAHHLTAPHPQGVGLKLAISDALDAAGLTTADISFINAHGTGTANNDTVEATVLNELFPQTPFISTKGMTGHTLGAAGAIEAIFTMGHLAAGGIPASAGFSEEDPALSASPARRHTPVHGKAAISQSLAFGGNNTVLVIGKGRAI
ncbi:3-oxoacyl-[acyl-carrier-protein] synthase-1/3-oxoacyl-[acyl-carrier-protein] synthase II [Desulfomicrobium macestii]|uniref:3-oxoacyl-[acyl-carrier-protein] synthase-1/3-oxoacyl-[acyl-carrier-protein] synthase II n=2 Tax=Desulfomicrobium TaxID=898 RepID=A0A8G2C3S0_DESNO|nr:MULTISPECIES: beta-ketoacyl-[acyl-carrier-protein] synthase family protein [Desulfomicrobium]MBE1426598.1 3-oxoacyl-[acyl-carrier-protein] synthase-1/3-oxoacyl-[acyl-carrier-protein] synthase II [Desulfomicrobium macestii]SFL85047.1 3-oxoacyl-[acyl-carrier-protein] synthase-1/3-oxoacyl-[acyl-carrier-protein] synthase II [Desulfomicrobium norvegicum]